MNSLQQKGRLFKSYKIAFAVLLGILVISAILAFTSGFESELRYFNNSPISIPFAITAIVTLALAVSSLFTLKGCSTERYPEPLFRFVSILPTIAVIRLVFHVIWSELSRLADAAENGTEATLDVWSLILIVAAVFSVIYNLLEIFNLNKILRMISGLMQIIFCIVAIAKLYIDFSIELNSPIKLLLQFSAAAMILCTLSDLRGELDIPNATIFSLSRICSASLGLVSAAALFAEILPSADKYADYYSVYALVFVAYGIKSAAEFFSASICSANNFKNEIILEIQEEEPGIIEENDSDTDPSSEAEAQPESEIQTENE